MSWQTYVDDHLMCDIEGNRLTAAAIIGQDGSVWAQSATFPQFKPEEISSIMKDFDEPGSLAPTGLYLAGTKYMVIQGEAGAVIRGKKGSGGVTVKKTAQALIFGIYEEPLTPGQCNMIVESKVIDPVPFRPERAGRPVPLQNPGQNGDVFVPGRIPACPGKTGRIPAGTPRFRTGRSVPVRTKTTSF